VAFLTILLGMVWLYRSQKAAVEEEIENDLVAIADLKADQITAWRRERQGDAAVLSESPFLSRQVERFLNDPTERNAGPLRLHFRNLQSHYDYSEVLLLDRRGRVRLRLQDQPEIHEGFKTALTRALDSRQPQFTRLHRETEDSPVEISVVAPIFPDEGATTPALGAIVLVSNASRFLYPLIQDWPTPSRTAETLLVRRDEDGILVLNDLRHRPNTALRLRMPLAGNEAPTVKAVETRGSLIPGTDYRGEAVLAVGRRISASPWVMVAKVDEAEVYSGWRSRAPLILGLGLALIAGLGALTLVLWQRNRKAHYRALHASEARLRASMERQSVTLQAIGDGVIATDFRGRTEFLNPVAETLTGWNNEEARGRPAEDIFRIVHETTGDPVEDPVGRVLREGMVLGLGNHTLLLARDGTERPIADSAAPIRDEQGEITGVVLVFRDQSEERRRQNLIRARLTLVEYAATHTIDELLTRTLDEIGALVNSPIGFYHFVDEDQETVSLQQWSTRTLEEFCRAEGKGMHYGLEEAGVWADCVRKRGPVIHNDYASLSHKKGMPEGHAEVVRELVVPVMREGKIRSIMGVGNKPRDYTSEDVETVAYLADVTWHLVEEKRTEQALQKSEARYRELVESTASISWEYDIGEDRWVYVAPQVESLLGWAPEEWTDLAFWVDNLHPDDRGEAYEYCMACTQKGEDHLLEYRFRSKGGDYRWIRDVVGVETEEGRPVTLRGVIIDITDQKEAEEELDEERRRLSTLLGHLPGMAYRCRNDPDWTMEFVSDGCASLTGFRADELVENRVTSYADLIHPDDQRKVWEEVQAGVRGERSYEIVYRIQARDGSEKWVWERGQAILEESGDVRALEGFISDITKRRRAEIEREKLQSQLTQAQKMESVGRLAGGVAHDFNNMLNVILGFTELAMNRVSTAFPTKTDPDKRNAHLKEIRTDLDEIRKAGERSAEITRQLLAFARKQTIAPRVLDLNETVEGMLRMLRRLIGEDIDLAWLPGRNLWSVKMDPSQIDQVLANLCVNARDAIPDTGKLTIETATRTFDEAYCADHPGFVPGDFVLLAVSDDGEGMDSGTLDNLFEPFFTTKGEHRGTGLGLATVYGIVKQNDGFINVYSEPGEGTTFKIYLPRYTGDATAPARTEARSEAPTARGETVLLAEDEPGLLKLGRRMLQKLGYSVLTAASPREALQTAEVHRGPIHLLVTDVVMPEMNGRELASEVRDLYPELRTLFMSGYTANVIAHHGVLDEEVHFIQKPFSMGELAASLREALDGSGRSS
jgi:PAS domain S-box-containing protein